jgi:hypothetical protein
MNPSLVLNMIYKHFFFHRHDVRKENSGVPVISKGKNPLITLDHFLVLNIVKSHF